MILHLSEIVAMRPLLILLALCAASCGTAFPNEWIPAYPIEDLTPKRKIGGLVRFNDPSFFFAENGKLITNHGRFKRHRTLNLNTANQQA